MSSYSNYTNTGSSSSSGSQATNTTKTYYEKKELYLKGSIVLCQHGFLGRDDTLNPLFQNLKENTLSSFFNCKFCDGILKASELSSNNCAVKEVVDAFVDNQTNNYFIRTLFEHPKAGHVSNQANELTKIIKFIKAELKEKGINDVPIVLVGYSKGGVVNCKCAINNQNDQIIDKIINVGTPHTDTLVQDLIQILGDSLKNEATIFDLANSLANKAIQALVDLVNAGIDILMNENIIYKDLKKEWNAMLNYPKFTPIAAEAIEINGVFKGDFIVPSYSAMATDFKGKTYSAIESNFIVKDDKVTIETEKLKKSLGEADFVVDLLAAGVETATGTDIIGIIELVYDIIGNLINNDGDLVKALKLAHCSIPIINNKDFMLTHYTIGMRVLAGLNA